MKYPITLRIGASTERVKSRQELARALNGADIDPAAEDDAIDSGRFPIVTDAEWGDPGSRYIDFAQCTTAQLLELWEALVPNGTAHEAPRTPHVETWEHVAAYVITEPDDSLLGVAAYTIEVAISQDSAGSWSLRAADTDNVRVSVPAATYASRTAAEEAAREIAEWEDEADGATAEEYLDSLTVDAIGQEDPEGSHQVRFHRAHAAPIIAERYTTERQARLAASSAQAKLNAAIPGTKLCSFRYHAAQQPQEPAQ